MKQQDFRDTYMDKPCMIKGKGPYTITKDRDDDICPLRWVRIFTHTDEQEFVEVIAIEKDSKNGDILYLYDPLHMKSVVTGENCYASIKIELSDIQIL